MNYRGIDAVSTSPTNRSEIREIPAMGSRKTAWGKCTNLDGGEKLPCQEAAAAADGAQSQTHLDLQSQPSHGRSGPSSWVDRCPPPPSLSPKKWRGSGMSGAPPGWGIVPTRLPARIPHKKAGGCRHSPTSSKSSHRGVSPQLSPPSLLPEQTPLASWSEAVWRREPERCVLLSEDHESSREGDQTSPATGAGVIGI